MIKIRTRAPLPLVVADRPVVPDRVQWLHTEVLKTRVVHGYCSRHLAAQACPYANICEQCDNYVTTTEFLPALRDQLDDAAALRDDAEARGWDSEVAPPTPASSPACNATSTGSHRNPSPASLDPRHEGPVKRLRVQEQAALPRPRTVAQRPAQIPDVSDCHAVARLTSES